MLQAEEVSFWKTLTAESFLNQMFVLQEIFLLTIYILSSEAKRTDIKLKIPLFQCT